jgi:IS30 family transposase
MANFFARLYMYASGLKIGKLILNSFSCTPYSSREKELIENTNKLIRQYIPKKANFENFNKQQIKDIQYRINSSSLPNLNFYFSK